MPHSMDKSGETCAQCVECRIGEECVRKGGFIVSSAMRGAELRSHALPYLDPGCSNEEVDHRMRSQNMRALLVILLMIGNGMAFPNVAMTDAAGGLPSPVVIIRAHGDAWCLPRCRLFMQTSNGSASTSRLHRLNTVMLGSGRRQAIGVPGIECQDAECAATLETMMDEGHGESSQERYPGAHLEVLTFNLTRSTAPAVMPTMLELETAGPPGDALDSDDKPVDALDPCLRDSRLAPALLMCLTLACSTAAAYTWLVLSSVE